jgi:hypothetical protein
MTLFHHASVAIRRATSPRGLVSVTCLTALGLACGCEDSAAQYRVEAQQAIAAASTDFRKATAGTVIYGDEHFDQRLRDLNAVVSRVSNLSNSEPGQQAAGGMLAGEALVELATMHLSHAQQIQQLNRQDRRSLESMVSAATRLHSRAAAQASLSTSAEKASLQRERQAAEASLNGLQQRINALEGPIADRTRNNVQGEAEADRLRSEANDLIRRAIELGVLDRGDVLAEALAPPQSSGDDDATATLCMSQDISTTDLETGEDAGAPAPPDDWLRIRADYQQVAGRWLIAEITAVEPTDCVPPSIAAATAQAWEIFTTARLDHERRGGGPDIGRMEEVVTERFAQTLQGIGPFDPPDVEPPAYTSFEITEATRTTALGEACRDGELEVVEWELVDGQWRIDFAGQVGEEVTPCP